MALDCLWRKQVRVSFYDCLRDNPGLMHSDSACLRQVSGETEAVIVESGIRATLITVG